MPSPSGLRAIPISIPLSEDLVVAAPARLMVVDKVEHTMAHQRPVAALAHDAHVLGSVGLPCRARGLAGHRIAAQRACSGAQYVRRPRAAASSLLGAEPCCECSGGALLASGALRSGAAGSEPAALPAGGAGHDSDAAHAPGPERRKTGLTSATPVRAAAEILCTSNSYIARLDAKVQWQAFRSRLRSQ